jgi:hypothetical protein
MKYSTSSAALVALFATAASLGAQAASAHGTANAYSTVRARTTSAGSTVATRRDGIRTVTVTASDYDAKDGKPHFMHGMVMELTVAAK